jgi:hypothetical protein
MGDDDQDRQAERDNGHSGETDGDGDREPSFRAVCPECEFDAETAEFDESAQFVSKHHQHTGHRMVWERAVFGSDVRPETTWELTCETCDETWTFGTEREALAYRQEHATYTDHAIEGTPTHRGLESVTDEVIADLVTELGEEFDKGVPEPLLYAHAGEASHEEVRHTLQRLKRQGTVFEPSPHRLETV